jgi:hypothetical protein
MKRISCLALMIVTVGCAGVRQEDLDPWVGQPVAALETQPVLATMRLIRTKASDGTEIWNYVNGVNVGSCSSGGFVYGGYIDWASYNSFSSCMSRFAACNNIFYVKNGRVLSYNPVGSGGARCYTNETLRPTFRGATNIR